ncbi:MAG: CDF family Co(II)/Ni(II) efflux transporter DmeF [Betaproteobacteria bacterium]|nr:CDF family Co(II)/Ni(II) efflux transporter DmeF [Betaproteobacteria bacterium]
MSDHDLAAWRHSHNFLDSRDDKRQQRTIWVVWLAFFTMLAEIVCGYLFGSMALLADGWHMASHVAALGLAVFAYRYARQQAGNARFTFGAGKVSALGGYSSAILLALVAFMMLGESLFRLYQPVQIAYNEALLVAVIGLLVNLISAWLLRDDHDHSHEPGHTHIHHSRQDHNFQSAFMHVLADLMTSALAIVALLAGSYLGWISLDPLMGIVGACVILYWAIGLIRASARTLMDAEDHAPLARAITETIESRPDHKVVDLHIWRIGPATCGCIVSLVSHQPDSTENYKRQIAELGQLAHITVEINRCDCPDTL